MAVPDDPLAEDRAAPRSPAMREGLMWATFLSLAVMWGSSFLFIRIGLEEGVPLFTIVSMRTIFGTIFLGLSLLAVRGGLPATLDGWRRIAVLAVLQIVLPFSLITWGQQYIPSGLAGVLNSLVPLYAVILASLVLFDEPLTLNRLAGVLIGFGGVVLMAVPRIAPSGLSEDTAMALLGMAAVGFASLWYAIAAVYARHRLSGRPLIRARDGTLRPIASLEISFAQTLVGATIMTAVAIVVDRPEGGLYAAPSTTAGWFAVLWLGILGTGLAYVLFYRLIATWGATRATLVTYIFPIVAVGLGFVFLGERLTPIELAGAALVIAGIVLVNASAGRRVLFARQRVAEGPLDAA
jgi:drug/metabolite transporter (DMT)-like permease